ncbi:hypothetical protein F5Y13DRAFT_190761 [Hypoxylon sp. FL1857]|nr:hypothetical protein F5Y13DRAFT_190761 [Hypoxylon sp. FL1857]
MSSHQQRHSTAQAARHQSTLTDQPITLLPLPQHIHDMFAQQPHQTPQQQAQRQMQQQVQPQVRPQAHQGVQPMAQPLAQKQAFPMDFNFQMSMVNQTPQQMGPQQGLTQQQFSLPEQMPMEMQMPMQTQMSVSQAPTTTPAPAPAEPQLRTQPRPGTQPQQGFVQTPMLTSAMNTPQDSTQQYTAGPGTQFSSQPFLTQYYFPLPKDATARFAENLRAFVKEQSTLDPPEDMFIEMMKTLGLPPVDCMTPDCIQYRNNKLFYWETFTRFVAENEFEHYTEPEKLIRLVKMMADEHFLDPGFVNHMMMLAYNFFKDNRPTPVESNRLYGLSIMLHERGLMADSPDGFMCHAAEQAFFNGPSFKEAYPEQDLWLASLE